LVWHTFASENASETTGVGKALQFAKLLLQSQQLLSQLILFLPQRLQDRENILMKTLKLLAQSRLQKLVK
jgi:hypothetical protein